MKTVKIDASAAIKSLSQRYKNLVDWKRECQTDDPREPFVDRELDFINQLIPAVMSGDYEEKMKELLDYYNTFIKMVNEFGYGGHFLQGDDTILDELLEKVQEVGLGSKERTLMDEAAVREKLGQMFPSFEPKVKLTDLTWK